MPTATQTRRSTRRQVVARTATKRCGVYIRVSTEQQVDRQSLSTQEAQLLAYANMHGWEVARVFT